jgi:hypothetical protein
MLSRLLNSQSAKYKKQKAKSASANQNNINNLARVSK